jgi:hypothetical protein
MPVNVIGTVGMEAQLMVGLVAAVGDLQVDVKGFRYDLGGTMGYYSGAVYQSVTDNSTNYVYLDAGALLVINTTGYPGTGLYIPLAKVVTADGIIQRIQDERVLLTVSPEGGGADDKKVKVSSDDTIANFLETKLAEGTGITLTTLNPGGDESLQIAGKNIKAGILIPGNFSGTPRKATVTFTTPYPDTNYSISIDAVTMNEITYPVTVESKAAGSFVVSLGSSNIAHLVEVGWSTTATGE